jgi:P-type Cu+ transporter
MKKIKLKIEGMHCSSCAMNIDFDLEDREGVKSVNTSYARQTTEIEYEENKISVSEIINQIKQTGYVAIPLET